VEWLKVKMRTQTSNKDPEAKLEDSSANKSDIALQHRRKEYDGAQETGQPSDYEFYGRTASFIEFVVDTEIRTVEKLFSPVKMHPFISNSILFLYL